MIIFRNTSRATDSEILSCILFVVIQLILLSCKMSWKIGLYFYLSTPISREHGLLRVLNMIGTVIVN